MTTSLEKSQRTVMVPEITRTNPRKSTDTGGLGLGAGSLSLILLLCIAVVVVCLTGRLIQPDRGQEEPWPAPT